MSPPLPLPSPLFLQDFHLSRLLASFYLFLCPLPAHSAYVTAFYGFILSIIAGLTIIVYVIW